MTRAPRSTLFEQGFDVLAVRPGRARLAEARVDEGLVELGRLDARFAAMPGLAVLDDLPAVGPEGIVPVGIGFDLLALDAETIGAVAVGLDLLRRRAQLVPGLRNGGDAGLLVKVLVVVEGAGRCEDGQEIGLPARRCPAPGDSRRSGCETAGVM